MTNLDPSRDISAPVAKVLVLWGAIGFSTWSDVASFAQALAALAAAFLSVLLISEWFWKKLWRPLFERKGWIKPKPRKVFTAAEWAQKMAEAEGNSDVAPLS